MVMGRQDFISLHAAHKPQGSALKKVV